MTTPTERMRALRFGEELLASIRGDSDLPAAIRQHATTLAVTYPTQIQLLAMMAVIGSRLPASAAQAVLATGESFADLDGRYSLSDQCRQRWHTTMRHYPSRQDGWANPSILQLSYVDELPAA